MSDITLCDFWKVKQVLPEWIDGNYGISAVFANTEKGNDWILKQQNVKIQKLSDEQMKYALQNLNTEKEYITKIVNSLIYEDKKIEKFFKQIELVLNSYIKKKIS